MECLEFKVIKMKSKIYYKIMFKFVVKEIKRYKLIFMKQKLLKILDYYGKDIEHMMKKRNSLKIKKNTLIILNLQIFKLIQQIQKQDNN